MTSITRSTPSTRLLTAVERSELLADVSRAGSSVAPYWPLTAFVAVNPLGGLQDRSFAAATDTARPWFSARTHLSLSAYRAERNRGQISDADLVAAIVRLVPDAAMAPPLTLGTAGVDVLDVLRFDLVEGPTGDESGGHHRQRAVDAFDEILATWCASFVDDAHVPWAMPDRDLGFYRSWRAVAAGDRRLRGLIGRDGCARIGDLPDDPAEMLALVIPDPDQHVTMVRTLVLRTPGWASFARWCDDWAPGDHAGVRLRMLDLAAVRAALDYLAPERLRPVEAVELDDGTLAQQRVDAIVEGLAVGTPSPSVKADLATWIDRVPASLRSEVWLSAHEWNFRDRLLSRLSAPASRPGDATRRPDAQLVFCIDVRSEGFRRHLESLGDYETFGFAGFFGVPVRWRPLGSPVAQARCPVLVSPRHEVVERPIDDDARYLASCSTAAGLHDAFYAAKGGIASPFALAESAGWFAGPVAAARTLAPAKAALDGETARSWRRRPRTAAVVDVDADLPSGLSLDERTLFAEAIVTTIGMSSFAPVVVLCGHGSVTTNNPHASSLDCGACGGAPGGASARIAVAILNDPDVRSALAERGIEIPADTRFVAAEHDTTADVVTIFDPDTIPDGNRAAVDSVQRHLDTAGAANALDRAHRLPGSPDRVRDRGHDWAQVRPEWGLAGNGAFIIGPRSITADHDLAGRSFLHSYVAEHDPDGVALETIMTAPLVVAQWISAQYYFSTVEPDVFGAGDKMLHNPVGGIGVVVGESGDLAVGLPMQSVMYGDQRAHDPIRLLGVIQAPIARIDGIVMRNPGLRQLVEGEWIHLVARESEHDDWSFRTPGGSWEPWRPADPDAAAATGLLTPLEIS